MKTKLKLKVGGVVRISPRHTEHYHCGRHVMLMEPDEATGRWRGVVLDPQDGGITFATIRVPNMVEPDPAQLPWRRVRTADRPGGSDYRHDGFVSGDFKRSLIVAGCRIFMGAEDARRHWKYRYRNFMGREENKRTNAWSLAFVRKVEARRRELRAAKKAKAAR